MAATTADDIDDDPPSAGTDTATSRRGLSYRGRMITGVLLVTTPVIILLVAALTWIGDESIVEAVSRANVERATGAAGRVAVWLGERELDLDTLVNSIDGDLDDIDAIEELLQQRQRAGDDFSVLQLLDEDGDVLAAAPASGAIDPGEHAWFSDALGGQAVLSDVYRDGDEIRLVIARPVGGGDGGAEAVLVGNVRVELVGELVGEADFQDSAEILVANRRNRLIYSTDSGVPESSAQLLLDGALTTQVDGSIVSAALEGSGTRRFTDYKGEDVFGGYAPVGDTGLVVEAKANADEALAPVDRLLRTGTIVGLLAILTLIAFAAIFARRESGYLRRLTASTEEAATQVRGRADSMSASAVELAMTTNQQRSAVTETSTTMEELSRSAARIADTARDVADQTSTTRDNLSQAQTEIEDSSRQTHELSEGVRRISDILQLINELADQTDMLALNAAIEAARAGEAGEGFAVVADEVRRLAERSKSSSGDIARIVSATAEQMTATLLTMERGTKQMHAGLELLHDVADAAEQVRLTTQQQQAATDQVVESMGMASEASAQVSETAEQIAGTATDLAGTAEALERSASEARRRF